MGNFQVQLSCKEFFPNQKLQDFNVSAQEFKHNSNQLIDELDIKKTKAYDYKDEELV